ncbi:MAG: DNA replication/repair protein RecF [Clostridia bacterium]|nr:DNA replication/repair protein RecF [Clostridia bacterium]
MVIKEIILKNYRNYESAEIAPCAEVTVFTGGNAQGKTNILEAVYLCCTGRSHRTSHDRELIKTGEDIAYVKLTVLRRDGEHEVEIALSGAGKRIIKINGSRAARSGELLGHVTGVLFAPEDLRMVKDGPALRRRFMDMELSQLRPSYYYALQRYNRALKQRGALLRQIAAGAQTADTLDMWDEELIQSGSEIMHIRAEFVKKLAERASVIHSGISGEKERLDVTYEPDTEIRQSAADTACALGEALLACRANDIKRLVTSAGPHRDDIGVFVNGMDARAFGSQGQVRTCALSLKLSEIELMREETGEAPVLMLDDVMSELDPERRRLLIDRLTGVQTLVTCTDKNDLAGANAGLMISVKNAVLTQEERL